MQPQPPVYPQQPPQPQGPPAAANPGQTGGILMLVACLALAIGTFTKSWVTASWDEGTESVKMGPLGIEVCDRDECESIGWSKIERGDADIKVTAQLSLFAGIASLVCAGIAGIMALSRSAQKIPVGVFVGIFSASAGVMAYFVVRSMSDGKGEISPGPGYSSVLAIGGIMMASIVLKTMLGPLRKPLLAAPAAHGYPQQPYQGQPMQQQPMQQQPYAQPGQQMAPPPPPQQMAQACPRCRGQLQYVAQYQRYFCPACQQYA
jgi:hypothetical protein